MIRFGYVPENGVVTIRFGAGSQLSVMSWGALNGTKAIQMEGWVETRFGTGQTITGLVVSLT